MRPEEDNTKVEFAVKLQNNVLCPIDSPWPVEKLKAVEDAYQSNDKKNLAEQKLIIENLKKEIFELKDDINEINLINKSSDNKKYFEEINILEKTIKSIQQKIKESIK